MVSDEISFACQMCKMYVDAFLELPFSTCVWQLGECSCAELAAAFPND